jgi:hypothetical protein
MRTARSSSRASGLPWAARREGSGGTERPRLRDLRQEVDRQAPYRQGGAAAGLHHRGERDNAPAQLVPTFGKMPLRDITKVAVRHRNDNAKGRQHRDPRAISKAYGLVRAIMNTAVDDDLIEAGPVHERRQRPAKRRRLEPATIEELDTIVAHMPDKWKLMIELASWWLFANEGVVAGW